MRAISSFLLEGSTRLPVIYADRSGTPYFAMRGASKPLRSQLPSTSGNVSKDQKPCAEISVRAGSNVVSSCPLFGGNVAHVIQVWPIVSLLAGGFLANAGSRLEIAIVPKPKARVFRKLRRSCIGFMVGSLISRFIVLPLDSYW